MYKIHLLILFLVLAKITTAQTFTQEIYTTSGGFYHQINGSMQFTIGEPLIETYQNNNGQLFQGFEQGNYVVSGINEISNNPAASCIIFPNPATNFVQIQFSSRNPYSTYHYKLLNTQGLEIATGNLTNPTETINLSNLSNSIYILQIADEKGYSQNFKLIKAQ